MQHNNKARKKQNTDITQRNNNEQKKTAPAMSFEKFGRIFSSNDDEEKQDEIEIITEIEGIPRKKATDNSKPKPKENIERSKSNNENPINRLNESKKYCPNLHKPNDGDKFTEEEKNAANMTSHILQIRNENLEAEINERKIKLEEKKKASEILIFEIHEAGTLEEVNKLKKKYTSKFFSHMYHNLFIARQINIEST